MGDEGARETFGDWLRRRRREHDLTQEELGSSVGYSAETIRKIEAGRRRPSRHLVRLLARRLGVRSAEVSALLLAARGTNNSRNGVEPGRTAAEQGTTHN